MITSILVLITCAITVVAGIRFFKEEEKRAKEEVMLKESRRFGRQPEMKKTWVWKSLGVFSLTPLFVEYIKWSTAGPNVPRVPSTVAGNAGTLIGVK